MITISSSCYRKQKYFSCSFFKFYFWKFNLGTVFKMVIRICGCRFPGVTTSGGQAFKWTFFPKRECLPLTKHDMKYDEKGEEPPHVLNQDVILLWDLKYHTSKTLQWNFFPCWSSQPSHGICTQQSMCPPSEPQTHAYNLKENTVNGFTVTLVLQRQDFYLKNVRCFLFFSVQ